MSSSRPWDARATPWSKGKVCLNKYDDWRKSLKNSDDWLASLLPGLEQSRAELAGRDPHDLAWRSACSYDAAANALTVPFWGQEYTLVFPEWIARDAQGRPASPDRQALLLMYFKLADGTPVNGEWLAYRQVPGGMFYAQAFSGYAERRLARAFAGDLEAFSAAARRLGGERLSLGHAAFEFAVLPRVRLAAVYWLGDEDFPSNASILFDAAASHYLGVDALAVVGSQLTSRLIRAKQELALDQAENLTGRPLKK